MGGRVAEALTFAPEQVDSALADADQRAPWRVALGLAEPSEQLSQAIGLMSRVVRSATATGGGRCATTSILPDGQITTQGTIVNRSLNFTLPITGGSGRYQGADGQVVSRDVSTPTQPQVELTFQLEN